MQKAAKCQGLVDAAHTAGPASTVTGRQGLPLHREHQGLKGQQATRSKEACRHGIRRCKDASRQL